MVMVCIHVIYWAGGQFDKTEPEVFDTAEAVVEIVLN